MTDHDPSLKELKEQFVSNLSGSSKLEIFCLISVLPLSCFLASWLTTWLGSLKFFRTRTTHLRLLGFLIEFSILLVPQIAMLTEALSPYKAFMLVAVLWAAVTMAGARAFSQRYLGDRLGQLTQLQLTVGSRRKPYVSGFRGGTMLLSLISILAVDFRAYPRRYAKAERHGTGLMDTGVGLLLVASALVARPALDESFSRMDWYRRLGRGLSSAGPIWVLGLGRLAATKLSGYQEHVGEYGVHWNFFFTLGVVLLVVHLLGAHPSTMWMVGRMVLMAHQSALAYGADQLPISKSAGGISSWVHGDKRGEGLLEANKEGIMSLGGYIGLYLLACHLGHVLQVSTTGCMKELAERHNTQSAQPLFPLWRWLSLLIARAVGSWVLVEALSYVEPVSRRACNAAYVAWMYGISLTMLLMLLATQLWTAAEGQIPQLLTAINRNMLPLFLLGNVLTGLVNMSVNTLEVAAGPAMGIIGVYLLVLCGVASVLDYMDITIRFL